MTKDAKYGFTILLVLVLGSLFLKYGMAYGFLYTLGYIAGWFFGGIVPMALLGVGCYVTYSVIRKAFTK